MLKKLLTYVTITTLLICGTLTIYADNETNSIIGQTESTATAAIVPDMNFTGTPIKLSLKEAIQRMQTAGPGYEVAVITKKTLEAAAKGQAENWSSLKDADALNVAADPSQPSPKKLIELTRPYLTSQAAIGYQIDLNNLESDTVESYYGLLLAQENLRISQDNTRIKNDLLVIVNKKFDLGIASKMDVLLAENEYLSAKTKASDAESTLSSATMAFNLQMGYPLMQKVVLTDALSQLTAPTESLTEAIQKSLNNRNEIIKAKYDWDAAKLKLDGVAMYPKDSSTYLDKQATLMSKKLAYDMSFKNIEMEIRNKYMNLNKISANIKLAQSNLENAQEGYRLTKLSYEAGMKTLTEVLAAQNDLFLAQLGLSQKINDFDLAIYDFKYSIGYGTGNAGAAAPAEE